VLVKKLLIMALGAIGVLAARRRRSRGSNDVWSAATDK
jgi:hypothetical protein